MIFLKILLLVLKIFRTKLKNVLMCTVTHAVNVCNKMTNVSLLMNFLEII